MTRTIKTVISAVVAVLLIALVCGGIVWIVNREGITLYVEYDGGRYLSTDKIRSIGNLNSGKHTFTVGSLTDKDMEYTVKIVPNTTVNFEYMNDGNVYLWSNRKDVNFSKHFKLETTDNEFEITVTEDTTVQSILTAEYGDTEIMEYVERIADYFVIEVTSGNGTVSIAFGIPLVPPVPTEGVTVEPGSITI